MLMNIDAQLVTAYWYLGLVYVLKDNWLSPTLTAWFAKGECSLGCQQSNLLRSFNMYRMIQGQLGLQCYVA